MIAQAVLAGSLLISGPLPGQTVSPNDFGLHVEQLTVGVPADLSLTAVRLWDNGVRWDEINTGPGQYSWERLDAAVANAQAAGATDILYVLGSTPQWAARNPQAPGLYGPGTTSLPAKNEYYVDFVREVVKRYAGRITGYQIWNEANTRSFYEGDWTALAQLTRRAYDTVKFHDPYARVVAASSTVIPDEKFATESFFVRYARALHKAGDPVDAMAVHLYPVDTKLGPDARVASMRAAQAVLNKVGINRPLWDTEVNYGDQREGLPRVVPDPQTGATYVARTYLDSIAQGISRTYWYGWDMRVLGVDLTGDQGITPAGRAFLTVRGWLTGARFGGCTSGSVRTCHYAGTDGRPFTIVWSPAPGPIPTEGLEVCRIDGSCSPAAATTDVGSEPILIR